MLNQFTLFSALLTAAPFGISAFAGEPPADFVLCVAARSVSPMVGLELYAGVKAQWPSLNIIPVHGGKASLEIIEETIVAYPPAQIDLESDESEATLKAGRNKLVIDFESGRAGKIKSLYLGHLEMQQIPMGKTVYPATLELNEKSIDLPASALNRDGEIDMSCVAVHR